MVRGSNPLGGTTDTFYTCYFFAIPTSFISITIDNISDDAEIIKGSLGSLSKNIAWIIGDGISARLERAPIDARADTFIPLSRDLAIRAAVETSASLIMTCQSRYKDIDIRSNATAIIISCIAEDRVQLITIDLRDPSLSATTPYNNAT